MVTVTAQRVRDLLSYDPNTGQFTWRVATSNRVKVGSVAGSKMSLGYLGIGVDGHTYYAHRLAWLYVHGAWPTELIDHANGDGLDNRIENLRPANKRLNAANAKRRADNSSGVKGVYWFASRGKWVAHIKGGGKKTLGYFDTREEAAAAYAAAAKFVFGEFART